MREIARGAEAVIFEDKETVIKQRFKKGYRIAELDDELRSQRTKRESNLLRKIKIAHPKLIDHDDKENIVMEKIHGEKLRDVLDKRPELARRAGEMVAELHNQHIIHGDLTTSNMILDEEDNLVFIDFGLSFQSQKVEDKAVDIHLFKQALNSKHHTVYERALREFFTGYKKAEQHDQIIERLKAVELRGRYKH
ncbi:MAG: KEOPS complex kinase/ATPase Bud32 [archaeon]